MLFVCLFFLLKIELRFFIVEVFNMNRRNKIIVIIIFVFIVSVVWFFVFVVNFVFFYYEMGIVFVFLGVGEGGSCGWLGDFFFFNCDFDFIDVYFIFFDG